MTTVIIALTSILYVSIHSHLSLLGGPAPILIILAMTALSLGQWRAALSWLTGIAFVGWFHPFEWRLIVAAAIIGLVSYFILHRVIDQDNRIITAITVAVATLAVLIIGMIGTSWNVLALFGSFVLCYAATLAWVWYSQRTHKKPYG